MKTENKKNNIIAISGKQFSGKDTVAEMLLKLLPDFKRIGIGDAIKIEYSRLTGLSLEEIEKNKPLYRPDLITLGDEGRAIDTFYWMKKIVEQDGNIIVPDMRLKKELEIFKDNGAITIRVNSSRECRSQRGILVKEDDLTETDLDDVSGWDYIIQNDSGLDELTVSARAIADDIKQKFA